MSAFQSILLVFNECATMIHILLFYRQFVEWIGLDVGQNTRSYHGLD